MSKDPSLSREGTPYYSTAENIHSLCQLPHSDEVFWQICRWGLEKASLHHGVLWPLVHRTQVNHWMTQLGDEIFIQQNVGTVENQIRKISFWAGETAMETLLKNNLAVSNISPCKWGSLKTLDMEFLGQSWQGKAEHWEPTPSRKWGWS
jgi:hypothetical protein